MQTLVDDGEDHRLRKADEEQTKPRRDDDLAKGQCAGDVSRSGKKLLHEVVFLSGETRLVDLQQQQRDHDRNETERVEYRDRAAADRRVDRGADERRDQAQPFSDGLEQAVRLAEQVARQDHRHEGRPGRGGKRAGGAVERSDRIDDPGIPAVVDEQKRQNHDRLDRVGRDHHLPPRQPVDQQSRERRE